MGREWTDERGLNSLQMLALLRSAARYVAPGSADATLFANAYEYLTVGNGYLENMINTRINSPCDINYSDDELTVRAGCGCCCVACAPGGARAHALAPR